MPQSGAKQRTGWAGKETMPVQGAARALLADRYELGEQHPPAEKTSGERLGSCAEDLLELGDRVTIPAG
jgi:hypothetical protein